MQQGRCRAGEGLVCPGGDLPTKQMQFSHQPFTGQPRDKGGPHPDRPGLSSTRRTSRWSTDVRGMDKTLAHHRKHVRIRLPTREMTPVTSSANMKESTRE